MACKAEPIENPENVDPIYSDLMSDQHASEASLASEKKTVADLKKTFAELPPRDPTRGQTTRALRAAELKVTALEQQSLYFEVRAKQRKEYDLKEYPRRFEAGLPWPDQKEVASFMEVKKLQNASMNWNDRVPKSNRYMKGGPPTDVKAKPKEGGHEE